MNRLNESVSFNSQLILFCRFLMSPREKLTNNHNLSPALTICSLTSVFKVKDSHSLKVLVPVGTKLMES